MVEPPRKRRTLPAVSRSFPMARKSLEDWLLQQRTRHLEEASQSACNNDDDDDDDDDCPSLSSFNSKDLLLMSKDNMFSSLDNVSTSTTTTSRRSSFTSYLPAIDFDFDIDIEDAKDDTDDHVDYHFDRATSSQTPPPPAKEGRRLSSISPTIITLENVEKALQIDQKWTTADDDDDMKDRMAALIIDRRRQRKDALVCFSSTEKQKQQNKPTPSKQRLDASPTCPQRRTSEIPANYILDK